MTGYLLGRPIWGPRMWTSFLSDSYPPVHPSLPIFSAQPPMEPSHIIHQRRESGKIHIPMTLEFHRDPNLRSPSGNNRSGLREKSAAKWIRNLTP